MSLNDSVYGGGMILKASLTIRQDDPLMTLISQSTKIGERASMGIRRCLNRHMQVMDATLPPNPDMVARLYNVTATSAHILHGISYTEKNTLSKAILGSTIHSDQRMELMSYIERISYAEYARLIEAVERMRV